MVVAFAQYLGAVCAVAGVVFAELLPHQDVLREGEHTVGHVLVQGHAALQRAAAQDARAEDHGVYALADYRNHGRDELRGVLVVGVQHHHDVPAQLQGLVVAALLVAAIAAVLPMHHNVPDADPFGFFHGGIGTVIVHEHHFIHDVERDFVVGLLQGVLGLVGGQHHDHFLPLVHVGQRWGWVENCGGAENVF